MTAPSFPRDFGTARLVGNPLLDDFVLFRTTQGLPSAIVKRMSNNIMSTIQARRTRNRKSVDFTLITGVSLVGEIAGSWVLFNDLARKGRDSRDKPKVRNAVKTRQARLATETA